MSSKWKFRVHLDSFEIHVAYLPGNQTAKLTWFFQACHDVSRTFANFDMLPYKSFIRWGVQGVLSLRVFFGPGPRTSLHGRSGIGLRRLAGAKGSRRGMVGVELVALVKGIKSLDIFSYIVSHSIKEILVPANRTWYRLPLHDPNLFTLDSNKL